MSMSGEEFTRWARLIIGSGKAESEERKLMAAHALGVYHATLEAYRLGYIGADQRGSYAAAMAHAETMAGVRR